MEHLNQDVTVVVLSYMSQDTISETLNSILSQTYDHGLIKIIITDDASNDKTLEIIDSWIRNHKHEFASVISIKNKVNLGIVKNMNGALRKVNTEWVKVIAADDLLLPNCISDFIEMANISRMDIFFSKMQLFSTIDNEKVLGKIYPPSFQQKILADSWTKQGDFLRYSSFSATPTAFIKNSILKEVGFADENYNMMEDYPLWLKINFKGYRFGFLDRITVLYRINESVSQSKHRLVSQNFLKDILNFEVYKLKELNIPVIQKIRMRIWISLFPNYIRTVKNNKNKFTKMGCLIINLLFKAGYFNNKKAMLFDKFLQCLKR